jgi:hypothetical protein
MPRGNFELEMLEPRQLLTAVFTVTNTNDSGDGSLRAAINNANVTPIPQSATILFSIPGSGLQTIKPLSPLPNITVQIDIEGTTDSNGNPLIELDGESAGAGATGLIFNRNTNGNIKPSIVSGLVINRFANNGIEIDGPGETDVFGCRIGTDSSGKRVRANGGGGVVISGSNNQIGLAGSGTEFQTIISGNTQGGIVLTGGNNTIQNCFIGTDVTGAKALPNGVDGIFIHSSDNLIGGARGGEGNLISGNQGSGISIIPVGMGAATRNTMLRNKVGTNLAGNAALQNLGAGIDIENNVSDGINAIGDDTPADENLISGNAGPGIDLEASDGVQIFQNLIGTDINDTKAVPNRGDGIDLDNSSHNSLDENIIGGNLGDGVLIFQNLGETADSNDFNNCIIGTNNSEDEISIPNGLNGINIENGSDNSIENTLLYNNGLAGLEIDGASASGNDFFFGGIFNNHKLGISIGDNSGTDHPNHPVSTGGGAGAGGTPVPEEELNHPLITSAIANGNHATISGTYLGDSGTTFTINLYASSSADASGFGQGEQQVDSTQVTTDTNGNASFTFDENEVPFHASTFYSAFAAKSITGGADISEFGNAVKVTGATVSGTVFNDANGNGKQDPGEKGLAKQIVFVDANGDGSFDSDLEIFATTNSNGNFTLFGPPTGAIHLNLVVAGGFSQTLPNPKKPFYKLTIAPLSHTGGIIFGERKSAATAITSSALFSPSMNSTMDDLLSKTKDKKLSDLLI